MCLGDAEPAVVNEVELRRSDVSYYLPMRDGVRIAVNLYFPARIAPSMPVTTLLAQTRYGRATSIRDTRIAAQLAAGRVVASIDTRGSTASFGVRHTEISPDQIADMEEIVAHLVRQTWSNGKVIAIGQSYLADTADLATSRPAPGLVGAIPMQADFDVYMNLFYPGGVVNTGFVWKWGALSHHLDLGRSTDNGGKDARLRAQDVPALFPSLQPVDDDPNAVQLRQALEGKQRWLAQDWLGVSFRDDRGANGFNVFLASPAAALAGIRRERKPVQYWGSWMDAGTADGALARFRSAPEVPMEVWITANDHSNAIGCDPLRPYDRAPYPSSEQMLEIQRLFIEKIEAGAAIVRVVHYFVMGAGVFRTSTQWPPSNIESQVFYFASNGKLQRTPTSSGIDRKEMKLTSSSGPCSRWTVQSTGVPADYGDRREADRDLMAYDTEAMSSDMELAGIPVLTLHVAARSTDPAFFVYLEDVAPDGRVTFLTEGQFRAIHRRIADPANLPYDQGPAPHSFKRADALEISSGERLRVEFALSAVAARIAEGHRLRIAIAAADSHMFAAYSNNGPEAFSIFFGGADGSRVALPLRRWG
jgi:uncharacterized protein